MIKRDSFTWLNYGSLGYFGFLLVALAPLMSYLGQELAYSRTLRGLHMSFYALGALAAGFLAHHAVKSFGRQRTFWYGAGGMTLAILILTVARHPALTLLAFFLVGILGSFFITVIQASLSDHHGPDATVALSEANVVAAITQTLPSLIMGGLAGAGINWRWSLWAVALIPLVAYRLWGRLSFDPPTTIQDPRTSEPDRPKTSLSGPFWISIVLLIFLVMTEWALNFWAITWLDQVLGLGPDGAALGFASFTLCLVLGRILGSRLARRHSPRALLLAILGLNLVVFPLFWISGTPILGLIFLGLLGLGFANLYPLGLAISLSLAPGQTDRASGKTLFAVGGGIIISPLLLGTLGDYLGMRIAFLAVPAFLILALLTLLLIKPQSKT